MLEDEFAVILMDVNMPTLDGLETAALIRNRRKTAHTPIIFITAYADEMHTARGYSLGAVDYILTPIVPDVLRTKVKVFVDLYLMASQIKDQAEQRIALAEEQAARLAAEETSRRPARGRRAKGRIPGHAFARAAQPDVGRSAIAVIEILKSGSRRPGEGALCARRDRPANHRQLFAPGGRPARVLAQHARQDRLARRDRFDPRAGPCIAAVETNRSLIDLRAAQPPPFAAESAITLQWRLGAQRADRRESSCTTPPSTQRTKAASCRFAAEQKPSSALSSGCGDSGIGIPTDLPRRHFHAFRAVAQRPARSRTAASAWACRW
jgi:CheY-like chemotaxis protein